MATSTALMPLPCSCAMRATAKPIELSIVTPATRIAGHISIIRPKPTNAQINQNGTTVVMATHDDDIVVRCGHAAGRLQRMRARGLARRCGPHTGRGRGEAASGPPPRARARESPVVGAAALAEPELEVGWFSETAGRRVTETYHYIQKIRAGSASPAASRSGGARPSMTARSSA